MVQRWLAMCKRTYVFCLAQKSYVFACDLMVVQRWLRVFINCPIIHWLYKIHMSKNIIIFFFIELTSEITNNTEIKSSIQFNSKKIHLSNVYKRKFSMFPMFTCILFLHYYKSWQQLLFIRILTVIFSFFSNLTL